MSSNSALHHYLFGNEILFRLPGDVRRIESQPHAEVSPVEVATNASSALQSASVSSFPKLRSRVLILVQTYGKGIAAEERAFLTKVLKAVHLDIDKVDLLELDSLESPDASEVVREHKADYILLFGVKPEMANLDVPLKLFEPIKLHGIWFLMSNSLVRIELEEAKRRDLWNALKKMFF
jgi:hypothetical protein